MPRACGYKYLYLPRTSNFRHQNGAGHRSMYIHYEMVSTTLHNYVLIGSLAVFCVCVCVNISMYMVRQAISLFFPRS